MDKYYVYHGENGMEGLNNVCSILLDFVNNGIPETAKNLYIFSDKCTGQYKNYTLTKNLLALVTIKTFDKIEIYYSARGQPSCLVIVILVK